MATFEFLENDLDEFFEVLVSADFEPELTPVEVAHVLEVCTNLLCSEVVHKLLVEGISSFKIRLKTLEVVFRFDKTEKTLAKFTSGQLEDLSRGSMQFVFYFFAKIDQHHRLGDVP